METPARHSFTLDGTTRVFPIPSNIKGDNYVRLEVDSVVINDRTKYDIVNNAIVFNNAADVPSGSQLDVLVVQSEEAIGQLGTTSSIDIVAENIAIISNVNAVLDDITTNADNIVDIQNAEENAASALASKNAAATSATNASNSATAAATSASNAASSATSASTSATTATTQATAAGTSATNASNSATAAATSASQAASSASAASTSASQASTSATAAATSATNASNSASSASTSATTATTQAGIATTQAGIATTQASNAASSASSASTSATNALTSANNASTSATEASTSASNAATSATNASTSATQASNSATAADSSASAAISAASDAAISETNAATSETNAATSATNAANSASSASTSASTATTQATNAATSASNASTSASAAAGSATSASAAADAALSALDSFDDRYLGTKSSDPTLDNDGNALVSGALYFNTVDNVMKVYDGSAWLAAYASLSGALIANNNLSDLNDVASARTNLGLGTSATTDSTAYATAAQGALADSALQSFTETDPVYTSSSWYTTTNNSSNWNTAYSWGNHASAGYLTSYTETDPVYTSSSWYTTTNNSSNWNTAYSWGNHASAGYLTSLSGALLTGDIGVTVQAYDTDIATVAASQAEMETGTETALRSMSPLRVKQAINATSSPAFPSGTRMAFQQTSAPTGWTKDTSAAINDSVLRLVTGTPSSGGSTAFSTFNASTATGAHTLSTTQMPSHSHSYVSLTSGTRLLSSSGDGSIRQFLSTVNTGGAGGGGSHTHSLATNIKYYDFIIASKD